MLNTEVSQGFHTFFSLLQKHSLLDLFLYPNCPLCKRPTPQIPCQYCQQQIFAYRRSQELPGKMPVWIWGQYEDAIKRAIARIKYNNHYQKSCPQLGKIFGHWLGADWLNYYGDQKNIVIVPIPLHSEKLKTRGFNQAELIAQGFAEMTGLPLVKNGLIRVKNTPALFGLSVAERKDVMNNALSVSKKLERYRHCRVLIIDDIFTTGTTIRQAYRCLRQNRFTIWGTVAIASPRLKSNPNSTG